MDRSDDSVRYFQKMDTLLLQQSTLMDQNVALSKQNETLMSMNASLEARIVALESVASSMSTQVETLKPESWICPVCEQPFKHRESYKGHIRRLVLSSSSGAHCFLDSEKEAHRALVSHPRYGDGDFDSRKHNFANQLYETVKSCSTSRRSSESSYRAVRIGAV